MSKIDITTRDLYMRLGGTGRSRSVKADLLFRRLRFDKQDTVKQEIMASAKMSDLTPAPRSGGKRRKPAREAS